MQKNKCTAVNLKNKIEELNKKVTYYNNVAGYLETYNKYSYIYDWYKIIEIKTSQTIIENYNVNPDIDLDKVLELIRKKNGIVMDLNKGYIKVKEKVKNLIEAWRLINEVSNGEERNNNIEIMK